MMIEQGLWRLKLVGEGWRRERFLPHAEAVEAKERALCDGEHRILAAYLDPPKKIIIRGLARVRQASPTHSGPASGRPTDERRFPI